jgi:hypothetical protein
MLAPCLEDAASTASLGWFKPLILAQPAAGKMFPPSAGRTQKGTPA